MNQQLTARKKATLELLETFQGLSRTEPKQLDQWIVTRLGTLIQNSRFSNTWWQEELPAWKKIYRPGISITEIIQNLPLLTREKFQASAEFSTVWIKNSNVGQYGASSTSGSTGKPVRVVKHGPTYNINFFATALLDAIWQDRDLTAPFAVIRAQGSSGKPFRVSEPFTYISEVGPTQTLYSKDLDPRAMLTIIARSQLGNLMGNAYLLMQLAEEQTANPISGLKVLELMNWAERLNPETRQFLKETFNAKVTDRYSSEEVGTIALQCPGGNHMHALQFSNYVEILDEEGNPCPIGETGKVVVTSLNNFAQPLIRYELGDMASWQEECASDIKLPVLNPEIYRIRETIKLSDGRRIQPNAASCRMAKDAAIQDIQVFRYRNAILVIYRSPVEVEQSRIPDYEQDLQLRFKTSDPVIFHRIRNVEKFSEYKRKDFIIVDSDVSFPPSEHELKDVVKLAI